MNTPSNSNTSPTEQSKTFSDVKVTTICGTSSSNKLITLIDMTQIKDDVDSNLEESSKATSLENLSPTSVVEVKVSIVYFETNTFLKIKYITYTILSCSIGKDGTSG